MFAKTLSTKALIRSLLAATAVSWGLVFTVPVVAAQDAKPAAAGGGADVVNVFKKADAGAKGYLSKEDVAKIDPKLLEKFDAADGDKDGKLTLKEFEALLSMK